VVFGALEALLASGDSVGIQRIVTAFQQIRYELLEEQRLHEHMLQRLRSWTTSTQVEQWVTRDASLDRALIRASRRLVRIFLVGRAKHVSPSGLTYEEVVKALDGSYSGVEDYCEHVVDPMGRDAETLALDALPQQLGIGLRLWILDRRDEVELVSLDTPAPDGKVHVHALFKPGHYDLLYLRETNCSNSPSRRGDGGLGNLPDQNLRPPSTDDMLAPNECVSEHNSSPERHPQLLGLLCPKRS